MKRLETHMYCTAEFRGELASLFVEQSLQWNLFMFYAVSLSFSHLIFSTTKTFLVIKPQPELVLKLFLNFGKFEPRLSYKVVLILKKACNAVLFHVRILDSMTKPIIYGKVLHCLDFTAQGNKMCLTALCLPTLTPYMQSRTHMNQLVFYVTNSLDECYSTIILLHFIIGDKKLRFTQTCQIRSTF